MPETRREPPDGTPETPPGRQEFPERNPCLAAQTGPTGVNQQFSWEPKEWNFKPFQSKPKGPNNPLPDNSFWPKVNSIPAVAPNPSFPWGRAVNPPNPSLCLLARHRPIHGTSMPGVGARTPQGKNPDCAKPLGPKRRHILHSVSGRIRCSQPIAAFSAWFGLHWRSTPGESVQRPPGCDQHPGHSPGDRGQYSGGAHFRYFSRAARLSTASYRCASLRTRPCLASYTHLFLRHKSTKV